MKNKTYKRVVGIYLAVLSLGLVVAVGIFLALHLRQPMYVELYSTRIREDAYMIWDNVLAIEDGDLMQILVINGERCRSLVYAENVATAEYLVFPFYLIFASNDGNVYVIPMQDCDTMQMLCDGHLEVAYEYCLGQASLDDYIAEYKTLEAEYQAKGSDVYYAEAFATLLERNGGYILPVASDNR